MLSELEIGDITVIGENEKKLRMHFKTNNLTRMAHSFADLHFLNFFIKNSSKIAFYITAHVVLKQFFDKTKVIV